MFNSKILLILFFSLSSRFVNGQVYHLSNDSVSFIIKAIIVKDTVDKIQVSIINRTSNSLYLCKKIKRQNIIYINSIDGPLKFACGCEYGFNQDYANDKIDDYEVVRINSKDTLIISLGGNVLSKKGRRFTKKQFLSASKVFKIDYVLTNSPLPFRDKKFIYDDFNRNAKRLMFSMDER